MKTIELGGGSNPKFHPNVDSRKVEGVDIIADFEKPLPLPSDEYDSVYSQYVLEHISWRNVQQCINEVYRILKPKGMAVIVTADLKAQAEMLLKKGNWTLKDIETVFGSQDYLENTHKSSMSPELAETLFKNAGFTNVKISHLPNCATDMIIEAMKMERAELFGRKYFDSEGYGTGKGDFYRDFPQHYKTAEEILKRKPVSLLEIGGARGYICKILQAHGVPATCMDISLHCWHTRAVKEFTLWDATNVPWVGLMTAEVGDYVQRLKATDKKYDLCFSIAFLEHIPEDKLEQTIREMARVTKRGLHGITFKITPEDKDPTHVTVKPIEWWQDVFKRYAPDYPVEVVDKESLEEPVTTLDWNVFTPKDGLVKLNIGCFADMFYYGWKNVDQIDLREWAKMRAYDFEMMDVKNGINRQNDSVDIILASHFLEHLDRAEGANFLAECFRVLKPDGLVRIAIPNALQLAEEYVHGDIMEYRHVNVGVDNAPDSAEAFFHLLLAGHKTIYDKASLKKALESAGFTDIEERKPFESSSKAIELQTISMYPTLSLYVEARKTQNMQRNAGVTITPKLATTHVENGAIISKVKATISETSKATSTRVDAKLKIALLSTPLLRVPPDNYGGLELIVANLGRELAKLGHNVTIFAPKGSKVDGCRMWETEEPKNTVFIDWLRAEETMFEQVKAELMTGGYDIIHGHNWFGMEYRAKTLDPRLKVCHTHHGGLLADWWTKTKAPFNLNMIGISDWMKSVYERQGIPTRTVYNGVDLSQYPLKKQKSDRFLWMSRIAFFKAPHLAIKVAQETGIKLDIAGATQFVEDAKYVEEIKKSCDSTLLPSGKLAYNNSNESDQIRFIGEVTHEQKVELLQNAKALLVTGKWGEPFGLHVVEALSCGTEVIAVADGGINETIKSGGILCQDIYALKDAVQNFFTIPPKTCRLNANQFSSQKLARNYEMAYKDIIAGHEW